MERHPTHFMSDELPGGLRAAAAGLAAFVGAAADDLVFVENATAGCNTVLAALHLSAGDEILLTDHAYPAVRMAAAHAAARSGARVGEASGFFPVRDATEIIAAVEQKLSTRTRLAIFDHVTSPTAVICPVRELTALAHAAGALVLIDGAHGPGMLDLDVPAIGADWYVGNCHKWLTAPKGCGFLWASPVRQAELHPLVISLGYGRGFAAEFAWIGTRDPSAWLAAPAAIEFHQRLGGPALRERNAALARCAADLLAKAWKTERGAPDPLTGAMGTVRMPLAGPATPERANELRVRLFDQHRIEVALTCFAGAIWARVSAHAYNRPDDYERLASAVVAIG
jgi:isopenicillin-N epimerase